MVLKWMTILCCEYVGSEKYIRSYGSEMRIKWYN